MKIAYVLGGLKRGGTETLILDIFRNSNNQEVQIIGIHREVGELKSEFENTPWPMFHIPFSINIFKYLINLRKCIKENKIEIAHSQQAWTTVILFFATLFTSVKIVSTTHGFDMPYNCFKKLILFISFRLSHINIFVSNYQFNYYINKYHLHRKGKNIVIYNGVDFSKFRKPSYDIPDFLNNHLNIFPRFCMVGNFVPGRNQLFICECLNILHERNINFNFYFIGEKSASKPELFDKCIAYCEKKNLVEKVHFVGARNDVPNILQHTDAFVYCTDHDTFGLAVVEAISSGIPVFVNDWDVFKEVCHGGDWAWLYPTGNIQVCSDLLVSFINNSEKFKSQSKVNALAIQKEYNLEKHIFELHNLYCTLLNNKI